MKNGAPRVRRVRNPTVRQLLGVCLLVSLGAIPTAAGSAVALPVRTLLVVRGTIEGFAQDGRYITWANPTPAYTNRRACPRIVQLRDLRTKKTWPLVGKRSPLCEEIGRLGGFQHRMALAGTRALWGNVTGSNQSFHVSLHTASKGRPSRALGTVSMDGGLAADYPFRPVPVAGDGSSLVFAHTGDSEEQEPYGVVRVGRRDTTLLADTEYTSAVAVEANRTLLARQVQPGCICNQGPVWSPDGQEIAFVSGRAEGVQKGRLYVMRADGSGLHAVAVGKGIWTPTWSPDGRLLAFGRGSSHPENGDGVVFVVDGDGRGLRRVGAGSQPRWSPDGRWLAFSGRSNDRYTVFRVPAGGGTPRRVASGSSPEWSPDGSRLTIGRDDGLYVVGVDGSGARRIAATRYAPTRSGWSPDGMLIAFSTYDSGRETWVVAPDGTNLRRLSSASAAVAWSPDSRSVVGTRQLDPPTGENVVVIAADGSGERSLGPGSTPTWSPGAAAIVFAAPSDDSWVGEIARIGADGSDRRVLTQTTPEPGRNVIELRATATGRVLASFNSERLPSEVALAGSRVALLYAKPRQLEIRSLSGTLLRQASVAGAANLSLSGRWAVYRTGRTIRGLDVRNGRSIVVARAAVVPVGLSLDGRRVAWAEQLGRTSRIRAVVLP
jgi:Tol biopolymer transport system component